MKLQEEKFQEHLTLYTFPYIAHRNDKVDQKLGDYINKFPEKSKQKIMFLRESEGVY